MQQSLLHHMQSLLINTLYTWIVTNCCLFILIGFQLILQIIYFSLQNQFLIYYILIHFRYIRLLLHSIHLLLNILTHQFCTQCLTHEVQFLKCFLIQSLEFIPCLIIRIIVLQFQLFLLTLFLSQSLSK